MKPYLKSRLRARASRANLASWRRLLAGNSGRQHPSLNGHSLQVAREMIHSCDIRRRCRVSRVTSSGTTTSGNVGQPTMPQPFAPQLTPSVGVVDSGATVSISLLLICR